MSLLPLSILYQIPRAVLCSEMGVQFSPCGRFLALCVAVDKPSEPARYVYECESVKHTSTLVPVVECVCVCCV